MERFLSGKPQYALVSHARRRTTLCGIPRPKNGCPWAEGPNFSGLREPLSAGRGSHKKGA
jgi:hypothetical protein